MGVVDDRIAARARQCAGLLQGLGRLDRQTFWLDHSRRPPGQRLCRGKMPFWQKKKRGVARRRVLRLFILFDDYFACDSLAVDDELVDVNPGQRLFPCIADVPVPVRAIRTAHRRRATERKTIERLARAPQNRDGHELGEHVVDLQGHHRPVTLEEQLPAHLERDRIRRVKRAILLWPDCGRRGLPQCPPRSPFHPRYPKPEPQHCPGVPLHPPLLLRTRRDFGTALLMPSDTRASRALIQTTSRLSPLSTSPAPGHRPRVRS